VNEAEQNTPGPRESLEFDVEAVRARLGPRKVALIGQWIAEVNGPLNEAIASHMTPDALVLDLGCSRGDPDLPAMLEGRGVVGLDTDMAGLRANHLASLCLQGTLRDLPLAAEAFDVVVAKWVVEHLEHPGIEFQECGRVLRPGGVFILLTPNTYSFFTILSRMLPYRLKQVFKGKLFGLHEEDTFRTWYRANSRRELERHLSRAGFREERFERLPGMWTFFIFSAIIARAVRALERIQLHIPGLRGTTTYIMGVWRKG